MTTEAKPFAPTVVKPARCLPQPLVEAVQRATAATFESICGEAPAAAGRSQAAQQRAAVIGLISFVGDHLWSVMLGIPRETAAPLAEAFAGIEFDFDSAEMGDIVGELTNVLAGHIIAQLDETGIRAEMSLPTVVRGSDIDVLPPGEAPSLDLRFTSAHGPFWVGLVLASPGWSMGRRPGH
jgi:CheY-specific phosphatase CheX